MKWYATVNDETKTVSFGVSTCARSAIVYGTLFMAMVCLVCPVEGLKRSREMLAFGVEGLAEAAVTVSLEAAVRSVL